MLRIIIGMALVLFDVFFYVGGNAMGIMFEYSELALASGENVPVMENIVGLFPDFIGFILLFFGMKAEQEKIKPFRHNKKYMLPFAIFGYGVYLANLYGELGGLGSALILLCGLVSVFSYIYAFFLIAKGLEFAEESYSVHIGAKRVSYIWKVYAMCCFLEYGALLIGVLKEGLPLLYIICYAAKIIGGIVAVVYITQAAIIYGEYRRNNRL